MVGQSRRSPGSADIIASKHGQIASKNGDKMPDDYWEQHATLFRNGGGMALAPDAPIWMDAGEVAHGSLSAMVEQWGQLPPSHQPTHVIKIANGQLSAESIRDLLDQPRYGTE